MFVFARNHFSANPKRNNISQSPVGSNLSFDSRRATRVIFLARSRSHFQILVTVPDSIITGEPNEFVREIQARMPVFLPEEHHDRLSGEAGKEVVVPLPTGRKEAAKTLWNRLRSGTNLSMPIYSESRAFPSVQFQKYQYL